MRKGLLMVLAVVLVAAMAAPAMADLSTSGFVRIKARVEQGYLNGYSGGGFITPGKDAGTASYVEQRQRFILDWKGETAGARAYFEIDFSSWGDAAYNNGRNAGAGLEADSVNLETKNFYLWFNVPNTSMKVTAGVQNFNDSFGGMILGYADMAGIFVTGKMDPVTYRAGWAKFSEGLTATDDDVDFYAAEVKFAPTKESRLGINLYALRDASGQRSLSAGQYNLTNTLGRIFLDYDQGTTNFTYSPSVFYWLGVDGAAKAGPVGLSGYAFYNFGKIEKPVGLVGGSLTDNTSADVKAWAIDLRADANVGPAKVFLEGAYVSGTSDTDTDFKAPITGSNYALAGSFPLTSMDTQILFPNLDDINSSAALAYDVQNKGRGIIAIAGGAKMKFGDMLSGKLGLAYLQDAESPSSGVSKHKATEVNANVNYAVTKGMDIGLYGAYAFLSGWESYGKGVPGNGNAADDTVDPDNIYKLYVRMNYAF
jgi:hypothetical protein